MPTETTVTIDGKPPSPQLVQRIIMDEAGKAMRQGMAIVQGEAQRRVPVRTGTLRRSLNFTTKRMGATMIAGTVGTNLFYGPFLDRGTGLYGPLHHWIVAKGGGPMAWPGGFGKGGFSGGVRGKTTAGAGFTLSGRVRKGRAGSGAQFIFARKTRGIRPMFFMEDAQAITRGRVQKVFELHGKIAAERIEAAVGTKAAVKARTGYTHS